MSEQIMKAFCRRNGLIVVGPETPAGAYELATAPATLLAQTIDATAVAAFDSRLEGHYFVPGVPDAPNDHHALECVFDFQATLNKRLARVLSATNPALEVRHVSTEARI